VFKTALAYGVGAALAIGLLAIIGGKWIIAAFTSDPTVTSYTMQYIWIVALSYGFLAAAFVEASSFQALGKSWSGFWLFLLRLGVVTIPLAYVLTNVFDLHIWAVWTAIVAGNVISSVVGYFWIRHRMKKITMAEVPVDAKAS